MSAENLFSHETYPSEEAENRLESLDILRERLSAMAKQVNDMLEEQGAKPILDERGRITMSAYEGEFSYSRNRVEDDKLRIDNIESKFASQVKARDSEWYYYEYGVSSEKDVMRAWKKERTSSLSEQWEMYVSVLFHELFGEDFLVMRTSAFDDYVNGVDTLIVHKETGEIVCAVDEVSLGKNSDGKRRKQEKVRSANEEGGKRVSYGVVKKEGRLVLGENKHVPVLYAGIEVEDLQRMLFLSSLSTPERRVQAEEIALCKRLLDDMEAQAAEMELAVVAKEHERQAAPGQRISEQVPLEGSPVKRNIWAAQRRFADMRKRLEQYQSE